MSAFSTLCFFLVISSGLSFPGKEISKVRPEFLDHLLKTEQYELFADIMNIPDVNLIRSKEDERNENPMFNKDLKMGDILPAFGDLKEQSRQGIRFDLNPDSKWQNQYIPYYIAMDQFTLNELMVIRNSINAWNNQVSCLKLRPYRGENDYVYIMSGEGCWSSLGRIGGQQGLSLDSDGCVDQGTILHEFQHTAGYDHEHNRWDRDDHIEILWDNIPEDWESQYEKSDPDEFGLQRNYDYYSLMHYPVKVPDTDQDAFRVLANNIDLNRIGKGNNFTPTDIGKINDLYC